ncbi:MAG: hypothetical protein ABL879_08000 [Devosia sp.]
MSLKSLLCGLAALAIGALPASAMDSFNLGGAAKGNPSSVVYKFGGSDYVAVFVRGPADLMYAQVGSWDGGTWTGWAPIGTLALKGDPDCVARSNTRIDCVGVGPSNEVYWTTYDSAANTWTGWATLGGFATSDPSIVKTNDGATKLGVFVRGPANHLFMNTLESGSWTDWQDLDKVVGDKLSCVDLFNWGAHCYDSSGGSAVQLTNVTMTAGPALTTDDIGGAVNGKVSGISTGSGGDELRVFVRGPGNKLWVKTWDGDWGDWDQLGASMTSAPGCAMKKTGGDLWCATVGAGGAVKMYLLDDSEY